MAIQLELTEHLEEIVNTALQSGRYRDAEQLVGTALLRLEQDEVYEKKMSTLRKAVDDGFASGVAEDGVFDRVNESLRRKSATKGS